MFSSFSQTKLEVRVGFLFNRANSVKEPSAFLSYEVIELLAGLGVVAGGVGQDIDGGGGAGE